MIKISLIYNEEQMILPINPEEVKVERGSKGETNDIVGLGQISTPTEPELAKININSFFWGQQLKDASITRGRYISLGYNTAKQYADWFKTWQRSKKPAKWIVEASDANYQLSTILGPLWVTCEAFNYDVRAGEEEDVYYELSLMEYRPYGANVVVPVGEGAFDGSGEAQEAEMPPPERVDTRTILSQIYTTVAETNCVMIAGKLLGQYAIEQVKQLFDLNKEAFTNADNFIAPSPDEQGLPIEGKMKAGINIIIPDDWVTS